MRKLLSVLLLATAASPAWAGCELSSASQPCSTSNGNTYRTERNFGGGYNTYQNGTLNSQTQQDLSGGYVETFRSGEQRRYNYDPYAPRTGTGR